MRKPSEFVMPTERCGLRRVGACHQSRRRRPPPPRLVGMKPALFGWPWATLLTASSWAAIGAVRPSPTIVCTNERRETRPALTCSSSLRISCSSIGASATTKTRTRVLRCESLTRVADAGCSGAALMAHGGNLSLGRIFRTSGSAKFEVRTAGRPVRTARTLAKRGGRGFGEGQAEYAERYSFERQARKHALLG